MVISELIQNLNHTGITDSLADKKVSHLVNDSRHIVPGSVFLAIRGINSHALEHMTESQSEEVSAIIYEPDFDIEKFKSLQHKFIAIPELHRYVGIISQRFYAPLFTSPLIGVTGTNGKTSVTQFISQLSNYAFIGTNGYGDRENIIETSHTTPDALLTQRILTDLSKDYESVAMEVSSHAMALHRVDNVDFGIAVFTNLSQDHLDFHHDMEDYFQAKSKLFYKDSVKTTIVNTDDDYGYRLAQACRDKNQRVIAFGQNSRCSEFKESVKITTIALSHRGINAELALDLDGLRKSTDLLSPVWGAFNVYNILAATLALFAAGKPLPALLIQARRIHGIKGRIESIDCGENKTAIVDYAHTPDALKSTLLSLREHMVAHAANVDTQNKGKIFTVFGCGGDRDKTKRPLMAEAVNALSDFGIITDDNPRTEKSEDIISDIINAKIDTVRFRTIPSRKEAIEFGLTQLSSNDVLLVAGKGHEDYQIIGTKKTPFSDHDIIMEWLQ